jgi:hypothetical protein
LGYPKIQNIAYAGTRKGHKACNDDGGHPAPDGASPTQPYKCSQYFKIKIKVKINAVLANAEINTLDFDFNILTALKGWVGQAP